VKPLPGAALGFRAKPKSFAFKATVIVLRLILCKPRPEVGRTLVMGRSAARRAADSSQEGVLPITRVLSKPGAKDGEGLDFGAVHQLPLPARLQKYSGLNTS